MEEPRGEVRLEADTVWLDAHQMPELFQRDRTVVMRHIRNIYASGELDREATCAEFAQVAIRNTIQKEPFQITYEAGRKAVNSMAERITWLLYGEDGHKRLG